MRYLNDFYLFMFVIQMEVKIRTRVVNITKITYRSFIGVDMTGKDNIDLVLNEPRLEHHSHGLSFHVVVLVAVIPRRMHQNYKPWRLGSVHFRKLLFQPLILRSIHTFGHGKETRKMECK